MSIDFKSINYKRILSSYIHESALVYCSILPILHLKNEMHSLFQYLESKSDPQKFVGLGFNHIVKQVDYCNEFTFAYYQLVNELTKKNNKSIEELSLLLFCQRVLRILENLARICEDIEAKSFCYVDEFESAY